MINTQPHSRSRVPGVVNPIFSPTSPLFPVAVNSPITTGTGSNTGGSSWSHTIYAAANRLLVLGFGVRGFSSLASATFNGVGLTFLERSAFDAANNGATEIWYMVNPPVGTYTLGVTLAASDWWEAGVIDFVNVNQTTPFGATSGNTWANDTAPTATLATSLGDMVVGLVTREGFTCSINSPGVEEWHITADGNWSSDGGIVTPVGASTTIAWTLAASAIWAVSAATIKMA